MDEVFHWYQWLFVFFWQSFVQLSMGKLMKSKGKSTEHLMHSLGDKQ